MLTAADIEAMRAHLADSPKETLSLVEFGVEISGGFQVTYQASKAQWLEVLDLAAMAARIRER